MGKLWKRLNTKEFQHIFKKGNFISGRLITIVVDVDSKENLIGFAVKKKQKENRKC